MTGPKYCGCSIHRDMHGDCDSVCAANGCLPAMTNAAATGTPFDLYSRLAEPAPFSASVSIDAEVRRLWDAAMGRNAEPTFTEDAPHPKTVRAAALLAASNMVGGTAGFHPHASDVRAWETRVLDTARRFEHYINGTTDTPRKSESEDSPQ